MNLLWSDDLATGTLLSTAKVEIVKSEHKSLNQPKNDGNLIKLVLELKETHAVA